MSLKQHYLRMLTEGHTQTDELLNQGKTSRLEYLGDHIFKFTTYEKAYSEHLAKKALEVCAAVNDGKTFEYIEDKENRLWYLLMVNMPFFVDKLDWGSSIRGAWWSGSSHKIKFESCGLWLEGRQLYKQMEFTQEQWHEFVSAILAFSNDAAGVE